MAVLVHRSLTNSQAVAVAIASAPRFAAQPRRSLLSRIGETLWQWGRRIRERQELARLSERERHDIGVSHADVWHETSQWFWRAGRPF